MTVLAVIPFLPLALLFGGGGLFAWLAFRKKKVEPEENSSKQIGEPSKPAALPELTLMAGRTKARLYRNGDVWAGVVEGPRPSTTTDKDAGKTAVDMAQSFASSAATEPDAPITGLATNPPYDSVAFSVELRNGRWDWTVTSVSDQPTAPELLAAGQEASRSRGVLQVLSELTRRVQWLNVPAFEGSVAPPAPGISRLPGIVVTGNSLAVTSLPAWISYVSPFIREHLADGLSADQMMDEEIGSGSDLPPETKLSGRPIAEVRSAVQKIVNDADNEAYRGAAPIDEKIAALMVGMDLKPDWLVEQYADHVILVKPGTGGAAAGAGFGLNPGSVWQYLIWSGNQRGYDDRVKVSEQLSAGKKKGDALKAAKKLIDDDFQVFDDGGNDSATVNPNWNEVPDAGGWDPTTVDPMSIGKSVTKTISGLWSEDETHEIVLFDLNAGSNDERKDWTLDFGVCLYPTSDDPFGTLSQQLRETVIVNYGRFRIRQALPANIIGGDGGASLQPDDWADFNTPLTWHTQVRVKFERFKNQKRLRITKDPAVLEGESAQRVDACESRESRWPLPDQEVGFVVEGADNAWRTWKPVPRISVFVDGGTKLVMRLTYRGLPVFAEGNDVNKHRAMIDAVFKTKLKLQVKIKATGINAV